MGAAASRLDILTDLQCLSDRSLEEVERLVAAFQEQTYLALDELLFLELLSSLDEDEEALTQSFKRLASNGLVDGLQLCTIIILWSASPQRAKADLLFDAFDVNRQQRLSFDALVMMNTLAIAGLCRWGRVLLPESPAHAVALAMATEVYDQLQRPKDELISRDELFAWWARDAFVRSRLVDLGEEEDLPDSGSWHEVEYDLKLVPKAPPSYEGRGGPRKFVRSD